MKCFLKILLTVAGIAAGILLLTSNHKKVYVASYLEN